MTKSQQACASLDAQCSLKKDLENADFKANPLEGNRPAMRSFGTQKIKSNNLLTLLFPYCFLLSIISQIKMGNAQPGVFLNFTMSSSITLNTSSNLIIDYNDQVYYKLSNYFLDLSMVTLNEPLFFCLCVSSDCKAESVKWTFDSLVTLSQNTRGMSISDQLKKSPIICNNQNYYHTSEEKELYINLDSQIAQFYKQNQQLGIIVKSQTDQQGEYVLNLIQKRNFCRRCQNVTSCDSINCNCNCSTGFYGQYCNQNALIFKLGQGSDDTYSSAYQLMEKIYSKTLQFSASLTQRMLNQQSLVINNPSNQLPSLNSSNRQLQDSTVILTTQKSVQYIQLNIVPFSSNSSTNSTLSSFYFSFTKSAHDNFKIYIADSYQIYSGFISQTDFVRQIDFAESDTQLYLEVTTANKNGFNVNSLSSYDSTATSTNPSSSILTNSTLETYNATLLYDPLLSTQAYQLLIVNECGIDSACSNQIDIQYSLTNFLLPAKISSSTGQMYLFIFVGITICGVVGFCAYCIYRSIQQKRRKIKQASENEKKDQLGSEFKFQQMRNKADAAAEENNEDEETLKVKNQTGIIDLDIKECTNLQLQSGLHSQIASNNRILQTNSQRNMVTNHDRFAKRKYPIDGKLDEEQPPRSSSRVATSSENKSKMKQLFNNNLEKDKRQSKTKLLSEYQQKGIDIKFTPRSTQEIQLNKDLSKLKNDLKYDNVTTAHTLNNFGVNNSNHLYDISSQNTNAKYNSNPNSQNNIIILKQETNNLQAQIGSSEQQASRQLSVPSDGSHGLPLNKTNNARPLSHYESKKDEIDPSVQIQKLPKRESNGGYGYLTLNNITTNASNTINQLHSNQDFENQSPLEELIQGKPKHLIGQDEAKFQKQNTNKSLKHITKSPTINSHHYPTLKKNNISKTTNASNTQLNLNETFSEGDLSSQKKLGPAYNRAVNQENKVDIQEKKDINQIEIYKDNSSQDSSGEFNISQNLNLTCDRYMSELKGIDGSKIQNHRRNVLLMGNQRENLNEKAKNQKDTDDQNDLQSICHQEISNIMLKKQKEMDSIHDSRNNDAMEDMEQGIRMSQIIIGAQDNGENQCHGGAKIDDIKMETPEIFFQNCPKCQSKQHEFQLKLSVAGPDAVRPTDKYCSVCLMKAELSEVKMADSS